MDEDSIPIENRKSGRVMCDASVILNDPKSASIGADSVDVSEDGFRLESEQAFTPMARYELVFTLDDEAKDITCVATVVWCSKSKDGKYLSGFRFSHLSIDDRLKLRHFIQKNKNN